MISLTEAQDIVLGGCEPLGTVLVGCERMVGRVVAQDVVATEFIPPFANSAVDGFAVRAVDVSSAGLELEVLGVIGAGHAAKFSIGAGQAARIMTGAPVPEGADSIVMIEDTQMINESRVRCNKAARLGQAIRNIGEDVRAGDVVFVRGSVINAAGAGGVGEY